MFIMENVPLSAYSTMRLGGPAAYLTDVNSAQEIVEAVTWAQSQGLPCKMIGSGSNIVWSDDGFPGLVIVNKIMGFDTLNQDDDTMYATIGAGELWDYIVGKTVEMGYSGIEQLSLIPGTTGATPIQNVGAYGREISEVLTTLQAYDALQKQMVTLRGSECEFGYRTSRFKTTDKDRFFITNVTLRLTRQAPQPPFYRGLQTFLDEHKVSSYTPKTIREAVIAIRTAKLPDPLRVANNGSFFANPIIPADDFQQILADHPDVQYWRNETNDLVKLSAAWLIEQAGFKDVHDSETGMGTWPTQPLVLVNEHATSTASLLAFKQKIVEAVQQRFGVTLEQEPELV